MKRDNLGMLKNAESRLEKKSIVCVEQQVEKEVGQGRNGAARPADHIRRAWIYKAYKINRSETGKKIKKEDDIWYNEDDSRSAGRWPV